MLDVAYARSNFIEARKKLSKRGSEPVSLLDMFVGFDETRRLAITNAENLKAVQNQLSAEISQAKRRGEDASAFLNRSALLKAELVAVDEERKAAELKAVIPIYAVPNFPHDSVPEGYSAENNVEEKRWGEPRNFELEAKAHWELGEALGILDMQRASKISGARFAVYWREGAQMERALANFMVDQHTRQHGYTEVLPPAMVNSRTLFGTGQLPKFRDDLFNCIALGADYDSALETAQDYDEGDPDYDIGSLVGFVKSAKTDHWLIPTAEVPLTNLYRDETLEESRLPISLVASTACFRAEAGSYGKDTRGLIRQHQFQKVELVKFAHPETSYDELEKLTRDAETILELLELPYRRMLLCAGDMGFSAAKTYDLEVWLPGQNAYREISSCSNTEAFQARRANIKFKPRGGGKSEFVHTLNGSALAVGRTWVAIVENYQRADGSVAIPKVLQPYMGGKTVIEAKK